MKAKNIILLVTVAVAVIILFYGFGGSSDDTAYIEEIKKERAEKDRFMRASGESPFANAEEDFTGLKYFDPDPAYRIVADLIPVENKKAVLLPTSDGKEEHYVEYAHAVFVMEGIKNKLLILEVMEMGPLRGKLFLAFGDETSASETYGAGRYLDVHKVPGSTTITLDFNKAYNPYCAYKDTYSCPLPPAENLLKVAIKAGEKNYH